MKRIVLFLLLIFAAGGFAYFLASRTDGGTDPVNFLPKATIAMVDWKNSVDSYERFSHSGLGRQIAAINWPKILHDLGYPDDQITRLTDKAHELKVIIHSPLFRELFGRRFVLALLQNQGGYQNGRNDALIDNVVLIARPRHQASFIELFSFVFSRDLKLTKEHYRGMVIKTFAVNSDVSLATAVANGLVLAATSPEALKQCLDQSFKFLTNHQSGLKGNSAYHDLKKRSRNKDDLFVFLNIEGLRTMSKAPAGAKFDNEFSTVLQQMAKVSGPFQSFALFQQSGRSVNHYTSIVRFDPDRLDSLQATMYKRKPLRDSMLAGLPADLIAYFWTNTLDVRESWKSIQDELRRKDPELISSVEYWLKHNTGYTLNHALGMFGDELSINVAEIKTSGFFPVPRLTCRVQVVDVPGLRKILRNVFSGLQVRNDSVAGIPVYSVMLAGGLMQPSYAFIDDFLLFADSRQQIETILKPGRNMLLQDNQFRQVDVGLTEPNNFVLFTRNAELIDGLKELVSWAGTIIAIRDEQAGARSKILVDRVVLPLLDGLKMYRAKGARGFSTGRELIMESAVLLEKDKR